jgi:hypothetical protein
VFYVVGKAEHACLPVYPQRSLAGRQEKTLKKTGTTQIIQSIAVC